VPWELKSLRQGDYKLIYNPDQDSYELYDLATDSLAQQDLSSETRQVADQMKSQLLEWMAYTARTAEALPRAAPPAEYTPPEW
jgi:arylsulfatase A-like enzyme